MENLKFDKEIAAPLVIDPYNDFIFEGGKLWDCLKTVAEANDCVLTYCRSWMLRGRRRFAFSMRCIIAIAQTTTRPGSAPCGPS